MSITQHAASLKRLYADKKPLNELAHELVVRLKSKPPADGIEVGVLYQLEGKKINGANCTSLIVIPDTRAIFTDLSTGTVHSVDKYGVPKVSLIGTRQ